jgi:hypothetical protein
MSTKEKSGMNNREADAQNFDKPERLLGNWRREAFADGDRWNFRDAEPPSAPTTPVPASRQKS